MGHKTVVFRLFKIELANFFFPLENIPQILQLEELWDGRRGSQNSVSIFVFFRKWPFSGEDDRGKTSPRALVFTRCDIQSERL